MILGVTLRRGYDVAPTLMKWMGNWGQIFVSFRDNLCSVGKNIEQISNACELFTNNGVWLPPRFPKGGCNPGWTHPRQRRKEPKMTRGDSLGNVYAATLSRVKAQQRSRSKLRIQGLMWVCHWKRFFRVDKLCHAPGVEEWSTGLDIGSAPRIETLLACSLGLFRV